MKLIEEVFDMVEHDRIVKITDHGAAASEYLRHIADLLDCGQPPEDLGPRVILVGRMMARRT